jgi:hypothetical protein
MTYGTINVDSTVTSWGDTTGGLYGFKNRIINGAMMIDQRNAGASVTINTSSKTYTLDRWQANGQPTDGVFTVQQSSTAPAGFKNSALLTVTTADSSLTAGQYYLFCQRIEGYNVSDLAWGTASAASVTLSFWVRSSLTGQFGGAIENSAENRAYPFTYTINSANTWEQKAVTIAGDTSGTWVTDNGVGMFVWLDLGCGTDKRTTANTWASGNYYGATGDTNWISTNGATFYITGVQLEKGSTATSFDYRPYGTELALCQRYCYGQYNSTGQNYYYFGIGRVDSSAQTYGGVTFPVTMRTKPSITATISNTFYTDSMVPNSAAVIIDQAGVNGGTVSLSGTGGTTGQATRLLSAGTAQAYIIWSAEL